MEEVVVASGRRQITERLRVVVLGIVAAVLLVIVAGYSVEHANLATRMATLAQDNAALQETLDKARFDLEVEIATRSELERQLAETKERLRQTEEELAFVRAAGGRKPPE